MRKHPRQSRSRFTVEAILEAATQVFGKWGYERASTERIATRAGVSIGSLYQYFPAKETLLIWAVKHQARKNVSRIARLLDNARLDGTPTDLALRQAIAMTVRAHLRFSRVQQEGTRSIPGIRETIHDELRPLFEPAVEATARLLASDSDLEVNDPFLAAAFTVETLHERTHWFVDQGRNEGLDVEDFIDEVALLLGRYLGVSSMDAAGRSRSGSAEHPPSTG